MAELSQKDIQYYYNQLEPLGFSTIRGLIEESLYDTKLFIPSSDNVEVQQRLRSIQSDYIPKIVFLVEEYLQKLDELYYETPHYFHKKDDFRKAASINSDDLDYIIKRYSRQYESYAMLRKYQSLSDLCCRYVRLFAEKILQILREHPNYTDATLDIITIVAPAIAHENYGVPALAIVGALTVMCKRGIDKYIYGELHDIFNDQAPSEEINLH